MAIIMARNHHPPPWEYPPCRQAPKLEICGFLYYNITCKQESAMASIKGFLTNYFKQVHFNAMTPEVRARWNEYLKLPDLNNSMKDWRNQLMHETAPGSKKYENNDLPDILKELTDDQITELYKQMNDVISGMSEDKKLNNAEYTVAKTFIEDFYGDTKVFHIIKVSGPTDAALKKLVTSGLLDKLKQPIEDAIRYVGGEKKPSFRDIVDGITSGKYDKDSTFRNQLIDIFERVESAASWTWAQRPANQQALDDFINVRDDLIKGLQPDPTVADVERFKRNLKRDDDRNVLIRLYKKAKAKELFAAHDKYELIDTLDKARSEVDYDKTDSDNYLYPKTEKHLNFPQTVKDKWDKFYENRLEKWHNLGGDYMFQSRAAEDVVKAIKKENIKPTDGLEAILNNAEKIKSDMVHTGIQTPKHFEWFLKEMKVVKEADKDAFAACLFSGVSLRQVVQRVAMDAVKDGKIAEAKTALEILSAVKYENTTSKTLDALKTYFKENPEGILNNKDLSWNKNNEGVQFVTNALTKTIRVAGIAIATMATVAVNSVRKLGSKIHKENDDLAAAHNEWKKDAATQKTALGTLISDSAARETKAKAKLGIITTKFGSGATIAAEVATSTTKRETMLANTTLGTNLKAVKDFIDMGLGTAAEISAAQTFLENYKEYTEGLTTSLTVPPALATTSISTNASGIATYITDPTSKAVIAKWKDARKVQRGFDYATNQLKVASDELKANEDEMANWDANHKDRYDELIKYWNDLEYGRDMHLGRLFGGHYSRWGSKKKQQALHYQLFNNGMTKAA